MTKIENKYLCKLLMFILLIGISCEDPVVLDLPEGNDKLVVDGWVTNENKSHTIKLNKSISFNNQNDYPPLNNARVYVTDRLSFQYDFIEIGQSGLYKSDSLAFQGKQGDAYILHILLEDGSSYISNREVLFPLSELSEVSSDFFFDPRLPIDDEEAKKYFVQGQISDISNVNNFYRWKITVNDNIRNKPEELFLFDDKFTDGANFRVRANNVTMKENDVVILEHRSLTENAFIYFQQISAQLSSGVVPNTPPSIVFGNLNNVNDSTEVVLGYFGASAVSKANLIITP